MVRRRLPILLALVFLLGIAVPSASADPPEGVRYTVQRGDTLGHIAQRFRVSVEDLQRWNPGIRPSRMRIGQTVHIRNNLRRVRHRVREGETISAIARNYRVSRQALLRWNRGLRPDRIRAGANLLVYTEVPASRSQSVGTPQRGRLRFGVRLPPHPLYVIRDRRRAYGTVETVTLIRNAFEAVRRRFPETVPVRVHDISDHDGGHLAGHHSHQSGRDADISYFRRGASRAPAHFLTTSPRDLDAARQWQLVRYWLERQQAEAIFMDYSLIRRLYQHARSHGASRAQLSRWFQYPRAPENRLGVIRHHPQHRNHLHVRFVCHRTDPECREHAWSRPHSH